MGTPGWPCEEGSGNGLQVGCMQPVLEPALSPGCCVWPWDSWIGPRTLLLMSMTLGRGDKVAQEAAVSGIMHKRPADEIF